LWKGQGDEETGPGREGAGYKMAAASNDNDGGRGMPRKKLEINIYI
jgi:hypothetical protein